MTDAADSLEVIRASGVLVEQKSVRRTCSPFAPVGRIKGRLKRDCKQLNKCEMETVKNKTKQAGRPAKIIKKESGQQSDLAKQNTSLSGGRRQKPE